MTILIRDRAQDDKLVKVIEPLDTVELTYNWTTDDEENYGRLLYVRTFWPYYNGLEVKQLHKLYYGDYLNSNDEIESVLLKIRQTTEFKELEEVQVYRTCPVCPIYDELSEEEKAQQEANELAGYYNGDL
jgi:hypothetical protein